MRGNEIEVGGAGGGGGAAFVVVVDRFIVSPYAGYLQLHT
jgi:hypothetical protein